MIITKTNSLGSTFPMWDNFRFRKEEARGEKRFSFVDEVLDVEYGFLSGESLVFIHDKNAFSIRKTWQSIAAFGGRVIYRTYLLIWFSLYFAVSNIARVIR